MINQILINSFRATNFFQQSLKISENQRFFRGYQKRPVARDLLRKSEYPRKSEYTSERT